MHRMGRLNRGNMLWRLIVSSPWEPRNSNLRWLLEGGYVEHAREVTGPKDLSPRFVPSRGSKFSKRACFVLTEAGLRLTCVTAPVQMPLRRAA